MRISAAFVVGLASVLRSEATPKTDARGSSRDQFKWSLTVREEKN